MIVADTNLVLSCVLRGTTSAAALAVRARDKDWIAPRLLRSELLNALVKYVVIAKTLDRDLALKAFRRALDLVMLAEQESDAVDVLNTIEKFGLTAYDAEFVVLALQHNVRLVTLDKAILQAFPDVAINIADFAAGK
jgi:predicted nucleic acid-binding protein